MRDIKFRAWHKTQGWIEDFRLQADGTFCDEMDWEGAYYPTQDRRRKNIVLMQYTGLKDKNGKEIYEGDIIDKYLGYPPRVVNWTPIGRYTGWFATDENAEGAIKHLPIAEDNDFEVIGNIYENPEFINQPEL